MQHTFQVVSRVLRDGHVVEDCFRRGVHIEDLLLHKGEEVGCHRVGALSKLEELGLEDQVEESTCCLILLSDLLRNFDGEFFN